MKKINWSHRKMSTVFAFFCITIGWMFWSAGNTKGQTPPAGVVPPETQTETQSVQEVNFKYFHDQLAPFGTWVEVPGYGKCWYPEKIVAKNPDWRPYYDSGRWVQTDNGLFWESNYTWGDIPFHYGRWMRHNERWLWVPDYTWGPAWVAWRHGEEDRTIGWAPLPPGAVWADGGWRFHGHAVRDPAFDFGLGEDHFMFVRYDHFHAEFPHRLRGHEREYVFHIERERAHEFFGRSVIRNEFRSDEHGRHINEGIGRERFEHVERLTQHKVGHEHFQERHPVGDRERLAAYRAEPHTQFIKPGGQQSTSVSKVFRPPITSRSGTSNHSSSRTTSGSRTR